MDRKFLPKRRTVMRVLASQDEISYNKRNRLSIEGKTVTGQKRGSIWKNTAGILAPAVILALLLAGCGVKNENTAAAAVSETVSVSEPTLPGDAGEQEAFCLVTSDLHFTLSDVSSVYTLGKYTPELARAFAEEAAERKPDVILMCGDNTNSSRAEDLEALTDILAPLHEVGCEVILVTGNHDCGFTEEEFFGCIDRLCSVTERDPASYSYAVVTHGCRFLAMDDNTAVPGGERGKYKEETMEWLKRQLAEAEDAGERAASYKTVPLAIDRNGTRGLKEALTSEAETSGENLDSIVEAVLGKRYSRAKREEIGKLFAAFMSAYAEGTLADHREGIMGSPHYEDFLEAFAESNYGPWIRYMMETTAEPGNRAVIPLAECT
jgi:predicted phosphodiesterase